jgi:hypothetical protein
MKRRDLIEVIQSSQIAMKAVLDNWEKGDLAAAVRELQAVKTNEVDPAIAWWESDE